MTFVDTNVLVYAMAKGAPLGNRARAGLDALGTMEERSLSRQVLREYLAVMTRPQTWATPLALDQALADTEVLSRRFTVLEDGPHVWAELARLGQHHFFAGRQVHDANIVATMLAYGERRLITFNNADFQRFNGLIELVVL